MDHNKLKKDAVFKTLALNTGLPGNILLRIVELKRKSVRIGDMILSSSSP